MSKLKLKPAVKPAVKRKVTAAPGKANEPDVPKLRTGVYLDENRSTAIVYKVDHLSVSCIFLGGRRGITNDTVGADRFAKRFCVFLPAYPVRRAARIYLNSTIPKDAAAEKVLRVLINR